MKTIFVINGFNIHRTATDKKFKPLISGLQEKGFSVVPVDISWRQKTPTQFAAEFSKVYRDQASDYNIILGNSFGAVVALLTATDLMPNELYLCSLSPFFKEDRGKLPEEYAIRRFGKRRAEDLWMLSFDKLASKIKAKTTVTYGEKEKTLSPVLVERNEYAAKAIPGAKLHILVNAPHSITDETYTNELLKLFK